MISICLNKPEQLLLASSMGLTPDMFAVDAHKYIYMAMAYLIDKGEELDPISITSVYQDDNAKKSIEEMGGIEYIEQMKNAPVAPNTGLFVNHIIQAAARRDVYERAEAIQKKALKEQNGEAADFLTEAEQTMRELAIQYQMDQEVKKIGEGVGDRLKDRLLRPQDVIGIKTGWKAFDLAARGLVDGEVTVIGARSKVGKSTVILNWCKKIAIEDKVPTLYIDTEMYDHEQEDKLISMISGVPHDEIENGMFGKDTYNGYARDKIKAVQDASKQIKEGKLYHVYMPNFTIEKIQAVAREYQIKYGVRLVVFDYIKLPSSNGNLGEKEYQALGYLTSGLKDLAGLLQIPILTAVQLSRGAVGEKDFNEGMIAGSDRILHIVNRVCFLRRSTEEEYALTGATHQFKIGVQRMGKPLDWTPVHSEKDNWRLRMEA
ncbi:hypothetical protein [Bacillus phage PK1]